jgi:hypothetical protein
MTKEQWVNCSEKLPGVPWVGRIKVRNESGIIREYRCFAYDGKEFSWQSNEKGRAIAWLAFVDVPDPLDEMT